MCRSRSPSVVDRPFLQRGCRCALSLRDLTPEQNVVRLSCALELGRDEVAPAGGVRLLLTERRVSLRGASARRARHRHDRPHDERCADTRQQGHTSPCLKVRASRSTREAACFAGRPGVRRGPARFRVRFAAPNRGGVNATGAARSRTPRPAAPAATSSGPPQESVADCHRPHRGAPRGTRRM